MRVPGDRTRPISDRVKENLFNILGDAILDTRFLDLFAGTGSVGIEALSRGAAFALFVDNQRAAMETIIRNLAITNFQDRARVLRQDAFALLASEPEEPFDFIYIAPPQYHSLWSRALQAVTDQPDWLASAGRVIVQIDPKEETPLDLPGLNAVDRRKYGNTLLLFFDPV